MGINKAQHIKLKYDEAPPLYYSPFILFLLQLTLNLHILLIKTNLYLSFEVKSTDRRDPFKKN